MSVQVKKKFEELVTYLGKDTKGKEKAKRLKDAANELRKKLAAAEEKLEQMESVKDAARERADKAETVGTGLQVENGRLQRQVDILTAKLAECGFNSLTLSTAEPVKVDVMHSVIQRLFAKLPQYPRLLTEMRVPEGYVSVVDRETLANGWSDESLWQLGAAVALISSVEGCILVSAGALECEHKSLLATGPTWATVRCAVAAWFGYDSSVGSRDDEMQRVLDRQGPVHVVPALEPETGPRTRHAQRWWSR